MPIQAGQVVTATELNRLQPTSYSVTGTSNLAGPASNADVPGCTITFNTETNNAVYKAWIVVDHDMTAASTTISFGRLNVDGTNQATTTAAAQEVITDRLAGGQNYRGTLDTAGSHTFKVVASPPTNAQILGTNTTLVVEITEVV